jgi:hypothetical protein
LAPIETRRRAADDLAVQNADSNRRRTSVTQQGEISSHHSMRRFDGFEFLQIRVHDLLNQTPMRLTLWR